MKLHCMNCGKETELNKIYNDDLGYHRVCPECGASHDIDDETAFEFEKQLYEPMVMAALKDGWSPRSVCASIYELFQEYCISEDTEEYLYGIADPNGDCENDDDYSGPADDWFGDYPAPNLIEHNMERRLLHEIAREIAEDAALNSDFRIDLHSRYYNLKSGYVMSINKEHIRDMSGKFTGQDVFAIYVSSDDPKEVCDWYYTESLDLDELANKIMEIYDGIGKEVLA